MMAGERIGRLHLVILAGSGGGVPGGVYLSSDEADFIVADDETYVAIQ